ncbi:hypothetical protein KKG71_01710 [Patescibacteria group bacterium]|nr:hypothetical protein [Patescibacteria group bacterium]
MIEKKIKNVSKRQVVYIDIDDEITDVFERIKKSKIKEVFIVIPNRSVILQSAVNFKILKKKVDEIGKNLSIITHDSNGIHLAKQADITVYQNLEDDEEAEDDLDEEDTKKSEMTVSSISPISASSNEKSEDAPRRIARKRLSIAEILEKRRVLKKRSGASGSSAMQEKILKTQSFKQKKEDEEAKSVLDLRPSRRTIITLITISFVLLIIIGYIALPGAVILITPKSNVLTASTNVVFADSKKNATLLKTGTQNAVATYPISKTISFKSTYAATGKEFKGTNSKGKITIINKSENRWPLVVNTRFQSPEGYIYRINKAINIPAATGAGPGKVEAEVEADAKDAFDRIIGEKGNIGPAKFFLPGLRESSREKLYAESNAAFTGGTTDVTISVAKNDIDAAKKFAEDKVKDKVLAELLGEVDKYNQENNTKLSLLTGDGALKYGDVRVNIPKNLVGQKIKEFEVESEIPVKGVIYDHSELLKILNDELKKTQSPDKDLVKIDSDSIVYKIFETDTATQQLKVTATIKGIEQFYLDLDDDEDMKLIKKIRDRCSGVSVEEAKNFVQNLPEVNRVEIKSWPVWAPKMPAMAENIEIKISSGD